ncbi:MAG TPA: InlB B-repeat-containing protein [Propionibacteriaceae bacterium]
MAAVAIAAVGLVMAFAQAAPMDPPVMMQDPGAMITVSWLPVEAVGANDTTYTLSYDTTDPFTATQTVTTIGTSYVIHGVDGVTYYAIVQADDGSGVLSDPSSVSQVTADGTPPNSTFVPSPASPNGAHGWYTSATAVISVEETVSGLQSLTVNTTDVSADVVFGLPPDPSTYAVTLAEGVNDFSFSGIDVAGNTETPDKSASLKLDSVAPTCSVSVTPSTPTSAAITATITAGDAAPGSGVDHIDYVFLPIGNSPNGSTVWTSAAGSSVSPSVPAARRTLFARSVDVAGNVSGIMSADILFDATAPVTTAVTVPASPTGPSGSWLHAPTISLEVTDTDPIMTTYYSWNNTNTVATVGNAPVVPAGAGVQTLRFFSVDSAGNAEAIHVVTFLVQGQQSYTITFVSNGGSAVSPITQLYGTTVTAPVAPTKADYGFAGWYSDSGLTTPYTFTTMPFSNITLYAKWSADLHTITFVSNGGSAVTAITQGFGTVVTAPSAPTKTGNAFAGWYSDSGLTTPYTFTTMPASNITLYAKWTSVSYTLTYTPGSHGIITGESWQTVPYGSDGTTVTAVADPGYHFVSWSDGVLTAARADTNVVGDITVSASFAVTTYAIMPTAGLHGAILPSSVQDVASGTDATFTITADPGYHIADVLVDGVSVGALPSYAFHNVTAAHTISAQFALDALIHPRVVLTIRTSAHAGQSFAIIGDVTPATAGQPIIIQYKKPGSAVWVTAKYSPVFTRSGSMLGHFGLIFKCYKLGTWKFRARFPADATHTGYNAYDTVRIIR